MCQRHLHTSNTLYTCPTKILILTILFVSQHINKLLKMYYIKTFSIAPTLFYVKNLRTDDFFYKIVHSQVFCTKPLKTLGVSDRSILLLKCSKKLMSVQSETFLCWDKNKRWYHNTSICWYTGFLSKMWQILLIFWWRYITMFPGC